MPNVLSPRGDPGAVTPTTLTEQAYRALEERIVTLVLPPGEVLSEASLSAALGIGRTPVREALQRLAREGLVTILPRRGVMVAQFNVGAQLRMLEVRRELENLMARLAATRASVAERRAFRRLAAEMTESARRRDGLGFMRLDGEFNRSIAAAARNEFAANAIALMAGLSRRFWFMHHTRANDLETTARCHAAVARAVAAADPAGAGDASNRLLDHITEITRAALDW